MSSPGAFHFAVAAHPAGIHLTELDLFVDPRQPVARAFVSSASAYAAPAGTVLASRETLGLLRALGRDVGNATELAWSTPIELPAREGSVRVSIEPAGHALGAAQLVVEHARGRWVYAAEIGPRPGDTHPAARAVACDELLLPCPFGLPIFRFPERAPTLEAILAFCRGTIDEGHTPVLLAEPLAEAPEIARYLLSRAIAVSADEQVAAAAAAYESVGVSMGVADGRLRTRDAAATRDGTGVLLMAPSAHRAARKVRGSRVAFVSGLALIDAASEQKRADAAFVFSELADHDELIALARATGARRVTTVQGRSSGYAPAMATLLRDAGMAATTLEHARATEVT